jgi:pyruvate dehydrogenase E1 component alpha subunit
MSAIEREASGPHEPAHSHDKTQLARYYHQMLAIRRMEEALAKAYALRKFGGFLHLYIGQEAVAVGALAAIKPDDYVIATYREHAHAYAKGMPAKEILAELYGKATGCSKGLGGSMHLFDAARNFLGGYGIVGGHIPIAAGAAFASKYRGDGRVTLCFFGDGSVAQGAFHEGVALAALWRLPVVFICENNLYSMGTPLYRSLSVADVSQKALGYGIARDRFDGEDVIRVHDRVAEAVRRARNESSLDVRRRPLPHQGGGRGVEASRPDLVRA